MIKQVSQTVEIKEGFIQARYITKTYEILFNNIKQGTNLSEHNHIHFQYVICFQGSFDLIVAGERTMLKPGESKLIASSQYHSANAISDFKSLDFKYLPIDKEDTDLKTESHCWKNDLLRTSYEEVFLSRAIIKKLKIGQENCISLQLKPTKQYLAVTSKNILIRNNKTDYEIEPMQVYQITNEEKMEVVGLEPDTQFLYFEFQ